MEKYARLWDGNGSCGNMEPGQLLFLVIKDLLIIIRICNRGETNLWKKGYGLVVGTFACSEFGPQHLHLKILPWKRP